MKKIFIGLFFYDPAPETKGGGTEVLLKEIKDLGDNHTKGLNEVKTELKAVKDSVATEVKAAKDELQNEISAAKGEAQKATVKVDELEKKMNTAGAFGGKPQNQKSFGDAVKEAVEEKSDAISKMARGDKGVGPISMELKAVGDISVSGNVTGSVWGAVYQPGIIQSPKRKVHMRSVLPGGNIGPGTDYYFMKQSTEQGAPAFTAEGGSKPQIDEALVESSVKIEVLASFARITKKAMNNIPGFIAFLQSRMVERHLRAEDAAILYGNGTSPNLKGLLTSGNFTASSSSATILVEKIIDDIALLEDTYEREANVILLRPQHYWGFFKNKASGSGEYDLPKNVMIINSQLYIGGVLAVPTTALGINAGTPNTVDYAVGDLSGVQFLIQEGMKLEFFEQDGTNVTTNKVTVRLEQTCALPVYGGDYFIKGTATALF